MEEKSNKPNNPNNQRKPGKKPYYKKRPTPKPVKKKFWNADKIVSLSAMAIALFTLAVLLYQSYILDRQYELTVKQQKASVLPYLQLGQSYGSKYYTVFVSNQGLGPAFIDGLYVKELDSTTKISDIYNYYHKNTNNASDSLVSDYYSSLTKGMVLSPGETLELYSSKGEKSGIRPVYDFFNRYFDDDDSEIIMVEYRSVFDDSWIVESTLENIPKEDYGEIQVSSKQD
ncbi:hypothetical protein ESY86_00455 [Subsaximicrobium wynnwilliamsii]|uniref:Uncharacterized protein n=1 Tax=Subsaximicrobium wynnwilliamsii TaxID=291179 RepID=A0A5C6ZR84_9FLAO|nr:hypothetical protein [Subsaximicrobium wynnwilliamsii]TXD85057.1 hypothetical protein ESY87_01625 [Subsaximicrobium wynnwilliamsii]TXD91100.1 hypothetical protein ESY86_00455 [Subsaximicrobium wynnwilliamsii]TXE04494.1 hypothetical protein ESY88_03105 [Subsaximicrobium wynnwilliamsii]